MRALLLGGILVSGWLTCAVRAEQFDVLVYGATPAGIAAAIAAAEDGEKVLLAEPYGMVGGMVTNGLSHTDFRTFESLSGAYLRFTRRVVDYYRPEFGEQAEEVSVRGTNAEPKVNLAVFEKMLEEQPNITVRRRWAVEALQCSSSEGSGTDATPLRTMENVLLADAAGEKHAVNARYFIDATYEGDLLAAAGVKYRVGREARDEYGEALAPEEGDPQLQAYNFRLCMTREPANRVPIEKPEDYNREDFAALPALLESGQMTAVFGLKPDALIKAHLPSLPHGKYDINDMSLGPVRLSLPGLNLGWPDGGGGAAIRDGATDAIDAPPFSRVGLAEARERVFDVHVAWQMGLLWFLQNDPAVPAKFRDEAREWGWCKDEFVRSGHMPEQLYVREARRMLGAHIYTQADVVAAPGDARATLHRDSIAICDYQMNCHGTSHEGGRVGGKHAGEFYQSVPPYQVPAGVMVPGNVENLLVTCALSASHTGFCALRYEPLWMNLGEVAGHAVHLLREKRAPVQELPVAQLQARLQGAGAATIYVSDVAPESRDFAAVQWWGTEGGLHGLEPPPVKRLYGEKILGQYYEAFKGHEAKLAAVLDSKLEKRWRELAVGLGIDGDALLLADGKTTTRGEWIHAAWQAWLADRSLQR